MEPQHTTISIDKIYTLNIYLETNSEQSPVNTNEITDSQKEPKKQISRSERLIRILELSSKIISLIAGFSLVAITVIILLGIRQIGVIQISSLLKIISISFIGSIFSIGGLKLISLEANFRKQKEKLASLMPQAQPVVSYKGETRLSHGWQHFLFPSQDLLLIYGHECEAKLYKYNLQSFNFDCIWTYGEKVKLQTHFAQSAARYKDKLFALGDYSTGAITVYDLASNTCYALSSPTKAFVGQLDFSLDGKFLSIVCGHGSNSIVYILRLSSRELITMQGSGPVSWIDDRRIIFLRSQTIVVYDVADASEKILCDSHSKITHLTTDGQFIVYVESDNKASTIYSGDLNNFTPTSFLRLGCDLENIDLISGNLIIASSWSGESSDSSKLKLVGLDGELLHEFIYDSGYGHGYHKYSFLELGSSVYFSMTGKNGIVPVLDVSKRNIEIKVRINNHGDQPLSVERWVSVQLNEKESGFLLLSLLSHEGVFTLFGIDLTAKATT